MLNVGTKRSRIEESHSTHSSDEKNFVKNVEKVKNPLLYLSPEYQEYRSSTALNTRLMTNITRKFS